MRLQGYGQVHAKAAAVALPKPDIRFSIKARDKTIADISEADAFAQFGCRVALGIIFHC
jgi:hypothetical protein